MICPHSTWIHVFVHINLSSKAQDVQQFPKWLKSQQFIHSNLIDPTLNIARIFVMEQYPNNVICWYDNIWWNSITPWFTSNDDKKSSWELKTISLNMEMPTNHIWDIRQWLNENKQINVSAFSEAHPQSSIRSVLSGILFNEFYHKITSIF